MMDILLVSDEGLNDPWNSLDRMSHKRKQFPQETNFNKMKRLCGVSVDPWGQVEELTVDLDSTCSLSGLNVDLASSTFGNSDALLSLPSLSAFKQELLSPFNSPETKNGETPEQGSPHRPKSKQNSFPVKPIEYGQQNSPVNNDKTVCIENNGVTSAPATSTVHVSSPEESRDPLFIPEESRDPLFVPESSAINTEFQYVLAAPTSIATKVGDETLTYLNQGQPYEIKLKKLGDLSEYRGKILKSVIRLSFHERRLQYMEREQMAAWEASHPGDSILEVDLPLSYGIFDLRQDHSHLNAVEFLWDPTKEGGVYIKVNCISTEFTPKKHGGEKGVPFRIQVETFLQDDKALRRLHAASCQVKVFKLKGADRKHKQDREKIQKRPRIEQEKYQCSYEVTILSDIPVSNDFEYSPPLVTSQISSTEISRKQIVTTINVPKKEELPPAPDVTTPPDSPLQVVDCGRGPPRGDWGPSETSQWLQGNRYLAHSLSTYSGADLLRLSRDDLIQLCGLSDGIRLYNALHVRNTTPKLTLYVCVEPRERVFRAVYLSQLSQSELLQKICLALSIPSTQIAGFFFLGPADIRVLPTDELVSHLPDNTAYNVQLITDGKEKILMVLKQADVTAQQN